MTSGKLTSFEKDLIKEAYDWLKARNARWAAERKKRKENRKADLARKKAAL